MQVENLVHDLPLSVYLQEIEKIGKAVARPVIRFQAHTGGSADNIDMSDAGNDVRGRAVFIIPVIEVLDRTGKQIGPDLAINCGVVMKRRLHSVAFPGSGAINIVLEDFCDCFIFGDIDCAGRHSVHPFKCVYRTV